MTTPARGAAKFKARHAVRPKAADTVVDPEAEITPFERGRIKFLARHGSKSARALIEANPREADQTFGPDAA